MYKGVRFPLHSKEFFSSFAQGMKFAKNCIIWHKRNSECHSYVAAVSAIPCNMRILHFFSSPSTLPRYIYNTYVHICNAPSESALTAAIVAVVLLQLLMCRLPRFGLLSRNRCRRRRGRGRGVVLTHFAPSRQPPAFSLAHAGRGCATLGWAKRSLVANY